MATTKISTGVLKDGSVTSAKLDTNISIVGDLTVDTNTLFVDSASNNVGIGTSSPSTPLHVETSGNSVALFKSTTANSNIVFRDGTATADVTVGSVDNGQFRIQVNNSERLRIDSSGRVLINKTASESIGSVTAADLQIGTTGVGASIMSYAAAAGPAGIMVLGHGRGSSSGLLLNNDVIGQIRFAAGDGTDAQSLGGQISVEVDGTASANDMPSRMVFSTTSDNSNAATERMRVDSSGNVGIGTSSPAAKLDVEGLMLNGSTNPSIMDGGNLRKKLEWNGALNSFGVYNTTNAGVDWQTNLLVDSTGNVGIGTSNPNNNGGFTTLTINGATNGGVLSFSQADVRRGLIYTDSSTGDLITQSESLRNLRFNTSGGNERMRIDSSGTVLIGATSKLSTAYGSGFKTLSIQAESGDNAAILELAGNRNAGTGNQNGMIQFWNKTSTAVEVGRISSIQGSAVNSGDLQFITSSLGTAAERMRLEADGDLHVDGDVIAYSTTISDQRLKDDVQTIDNALDKVSNLRGVSYTWNNGNRKGQKDLGLIAQEVEQVLPELVREKEMPMIDGETYKTVDYEKIVGVLIEAVKELKAEVESLKSK